MSGLIRGKPLVWVRDGKCWRAESQFGVYYVHRSSQSDMYYWDLSPFDDTSTINEGEESTLETAQFACQLDHDSRAMASVEVVPFEWKQTAIGLCANVGNMTLCVWMSLLQSGWCWHLCAKTTRVIEAGTATDEQAAITAAETFVRQLVMGVPK